MKKTGEITIEITLKDYIYSTDEIYDEIKNHLKYVLGVNCNCKITHKKDVRPKGKNNLDDSFIMECDSCGNDDNSTFDFLSKGTDKEGKYEKYKCLLCGHINKVYWIDANDKKTGEFL